MAAATIVSPIARPVSHGSPFVSSIKPPEPFTFVMFGATGDLAGRKLLPSLAGLWKRQYLPEHFAIVGLGRSDKSDDAFRADVQKDLAEFGQKEAADATDFLSHVYYNRTDFTKPQGMDDLAARVRKLEQELNLPG